jgi:hypothetical protein
MAASIPNRVRAQFREVLELAANVTDRSIPDGGKTMLQYLLTWSLMVSPVKLTIQAYGQREALANCAVATATRQRSATPAMVARLMSARTATDKTAGHENKGRRGCQ